MAYATATLTGTYTKNGAPASGIVLISPNSDQLIDAEGDEIVVGGWREELVDGSFSIVLPATDDATIEPATGRQYRVSVRISGAHIPDVRGIELASGSTVDMADISSSDTTAAAYSVWLTQEDYVADAAEEAAARAEGDAANATLIRRRRPTLPGEPVGAYGGGQWKVQAQQGVAGGVTFVNQHTIAQACTEIRLVWTLGVIHPATTPATGETPFQQRFPVKATVQIGSTLYRVSFNGTRQGYIDPGAGPLVSDPLALDLAAGTTIKTRVYSALANGEWFGMSMASVPPGWTISDQGYTMNSDISDVTTAHSTNGPANFGGPNLIIGTTAATPGSSVFGVGDSIDSGGGFGADDPTYYTAGWMIRSFVGSNIPLFRATYPSTTVYGFRAAHAVELALASNFTHLLSGFGSNDIFYSRTYAQIVDDLTWLYTQARARGLKVLQRTIVPRTNAANTVPVAGFEAGGASVRGQVNAWIRAGGAGLIDHVIETADPVETARDSGLWKPSMATSDGAHTLTAAAVAMAAAFNPATDLP